MTSSEMPRQTSKFNELLGHYEVMAREGFKKTSGDIKKDGYGAQEAALFRTPLKHLFAEHQIKTVLDYGAGATPWDKKILPSGESLLAHVGNPTYLRFEPSRDVDERQSADAVVCFDVLEHIFIGDIAWVLHDIMRHAQKLVVLNVACYPARALLPNGENAHITLRAPLWWKGVVDMAASQHPALTVSLFCSPAHNKIHRFKDICFDTLTAAPGYVR